MDSQRRARRDTNAARIAAPSLTLDIPGSISPSMPSAASDLTTPTATIRSIFSTSSSSSGSRQTRPSRGGSTSSGEVTVRNNSSTVSPTTQSSNQRLLSAGSSSGLQIPPSSTRSLTQQSPRTSVSGDAANQASSSSQSATPSSTTPVPRPIPPRYGLHESLTHPEKHYKRKPNFHLFSAEPLPCTWMHWSRAAVHGALPTHCFRSSTSTAVENMIWIFGGRVDQDASDEGSKVHEPLPPRGTLFRNVWCFDAETFLWSHPQMQGDCPPPLRAHTACRYGRSSIIFFGGGVGLDYENNIWSLDTRTRRWTNLMPFVDRSSPVPSKRRAHSSVIYQSRMYVFGGGNGLGALNDLWVLDLSDMRNLRWYEIKFSDHNMRTPPPRGYHTANLVKSTMIIYGGLDLSTKSNTKSDIWIIDLDKLIWHDVTPKDSPSLAFHSATVIGSLLFVFGGHDGITYFLRTHIFNLAELCWEDKHHIGGRPPSPRGYHTAVYTDLRLFVFGGRDDRANFDDCYVLDLAAQSYLPTVTNFEIIPPDEDEYDDYGP